MPNLQTILSRGNSGSDGVPARFFPDYEGEGRLALYRRDDRTKKYVFHGLLGLDEGTEQRVSELFGGGVYRVQLRAIDPEQGGEKIKGSFDFDLSGAYKTPTALPNAGSPGVTTDGPAPAATVGTLGDQSNPLLLINQALASQVLDMLKVSKELAAVRTAPQSGGMSEVLLALLPMVLEIVKAIIERPSPSAVDTRRELLDMMAQMREMVTVTAPPNPSDPSVVLSSIVGAIKQLREVSQEVNPREDQPDPLLASIPELTKILGQGMAQQANRPAPSARRGPPVAGQINPALPTWHKVLLQNKRQLLSFAAMGADPEWAAEGAVQLMPPAIANDMYEFVQREDYIQLAIGAVPELQRFPEWTQKFFVSARNFLLGVEDEAEEIDDDDTGDDPPEVGGQT